MGAKKTIAKITGVTAAGITLAYAADGCFNNGEAMVKPTGRWIVERVEEFIKDADEQIKKEPVLGWSAQQPYEHEATAWSEVDHSAATLPTYSGNLAASAFIQIDPSALETGPGLQG